MAQAVCQAPPARAAPVPACTGTDCAGGDAAPVPRYPPGAMPLRRRHPRLGPLLALLAAAALVGALAPPASAVAVNRTWDARLGGSSGTASLRSYTDGTGRLTLDIAGFMAGATLPVIVYRGSCTTPTTIARFNPVTVDATGAASRSSAVGSWAMGIIWSYARSGSIAIKVGNGSGARCGALTYPVATRVVVPSLGIDLPVILQKTSYPPCNVAMYMRELYQPREAGVTFIYAHARTGMFLPLLAGSRVNNGASLIGRKVQVYTGENLVYTYEITRVRRHVTSADGIFDITSRQLWLQTSEGPSGTVAKLIVVAKPIGIASTSYAAAHPTSKPLYCR